MVRAAPHNQAVAQLKGDVFEDPEAVGDDLARVQAQAGPHSSGAGGGLRPMRVASSNRCGQSGRGTRRGPASLARCAVDLVACAGGLRGGAGSIARAFTPGVHSGQGPSAWPSCLHAG